jgi:hypothetical protein
MAKISTYPDAGDMQESDEFIAARGAGNVSYTAKGLRKGVQSGHRIDIRDLATGFTMDGTADDATAWANAMTAAPDKATILIPGRSIFLGSASTIPAKNLQFECAEGARFIRKSAIVFLTVQTALDIAGKQAFTSLSINSSGAYPLSTSNAIQTAIQVADASLYAPGDIIKVVAEEETPGCVPFDVGHTKKNRLGQICIVTKVDTGTDLVYVAGEIEDRTLYATGRFVIKMNKDKFSWKGGSFYSEGAWIGGGSYNYFNLLSRPRARMERMNFENGSGTAINVVGNVETVISDIDTAEMGNTSLCPGYGVICTSSTSTTMRRITGRGDMRHAADSNVAQTSDGTLNYDYYGKSRAPRYFEVEDFGSGHSPIAPHLPTAGILIDGVRSISSVSGRNAQGGGVSIRGRRALVKNVHIEDRPVGIEVNDQVDGECQDNTFDGGIIYRTTSAAISCSLISNGTTENGTAVRNLRVMNYEIAIERGTVYALCKGTYTFKNIKAKLNGAVALSTGCMGVCSGNDVEAEFVECEWDPSGYTGASAVYAWQESSTARTGIRIRFVRCKFKGVAADWTAILDCGTPVGTGAANRNRYEFVDCEFPAGVTIVANKGTAIVNVRERRFMDRTVVFPAVGELLMPINDPHGTADSSAVNGSLIAGITAYACFEIPRVATWNAGIWLLTAQTSAEVRFAAYSADERGWIDRLLDDMGIYDASALPSGAAGFAGSASTWTNPFPGRFWIQMQLKPRATTQITFKRIGAVSGYQFPMTPAQWAAGTSFAPARGILSTETYGAPAATPTSPGPTQDTALNPVIMLKRAA